MASMDFAWQSPTTFLPWLSNTNGRKPSCPSNSPQDKHKPWSATDLSSSCHQLSLFEPLGVNLPWEQTLRNHREVTRATYSLFDDKLESVLLSVFCQDWTHEAQAIKHPNRLLVIQVESLVLARIRRYTQSRRLLQGRSNSSPLQSQKVTEAQFIDTRQLCLPKRNRRSLVQPERVAQIGLKRLTVSRTALLTTTKEKKMKIMRLKTLI